uniref:Nedd4 family interacting protein 2 n=1 Tax=Gadus morhua TaxID=8049 RepID=A0A8C4Z9T7_GADMO
MTPVLAMLPPPPHTTHYQTRQILTDMADMEYIIHKYVFVNLYIIPFKFELFFGADFPVPPPYSVATSLPTYDEAEKAKADAMAAHPLDVLMQRDEDFPPRDDFSEADQLRVGNDGIFMLAFFMAFLFNWIGFCLSFCLTNTIAGRYGAICGFGLSLIKWILIVRFSDYFTGYFNGQYWLWWIFLLFGLMVFFRGFVNYLKVRNMSENMASSHRTRFFFLC